VLAVLGLLAVEESDSFDAAACSGGGFISASRLLPWFSVSGW
jgi:hypothetical protein